MEQYLKLRTTGKESEQAAHPRVLLHKEMSTQVRCDGYLFPQWLDDTHLCYGTGYDFVNYNIDDDSISTVTRPNDQTEVITAYFIKQFNFSGIQVIYLVHKQNRFYLCITPSATPFKMELGFKSQTQKVHSLFQIQDSIIVIIITKNYKKCVMFINLHTNFTEIYQRKESIIKVIETKIPSILILQTEKQLLLARLDSDMLTLSIVSTFGLNNQYSIQMLSDYSTHRLVLTSEEQVLLLPFNERRFGKVIHNPIDVEQIGGMTSNMKTLIVWEKNLPIIHQYQLKEDNLTFKNKTQLPLGLAVISSISFSQKNRNILILTKHNGFVKDILIFKLELYTQLRTSDPGIYMKPLKYVYRQKKVNELAISKVANSPYALTGIQVHSLSESILEGILSFDVHPLGLYMVVSFGFAAKVYSIENNNISLIYTYTMQNIKRVKYSPSGAQLVIFSTRQIRILDAYGFRVKHQINEKVNSFIDFSFGYSGYFMYALADNGNLYTYSAMDFKKLQILRNHTTDKLVECKVDQQCERQCLLTDKGCLIFRNRFSNLKLIEYQMEERITAFQIDSKHGVIFVGTQSGRIRAHLWPIEHVQQLNHYDQVRIGFCEITCMLLGHRKPQLFVGSSDGNISWIKYKVKSNQVNPYFDDQGEYSSKSIGFDKYTLCSNLQQQNAEQIILESKFEEIINKIVEQMKQFRFEFKKDFQKKQQSFVYKTDNHQVYQYNKEKVHSLEREGVQLEENFYNEKKQMEQAYEKKIKEITLEQQKLNSQKFLLICKQQSFKKTERNEKSKQMDIMTHQCNQLVWERSRMVEKANIQTLEPYVEADVVPDNNMDILREYSGLLAEELRKQNAKCNDLRKQHIYLKTAKTNILDRKIKEETLQFRVLRQIGEMKQTRDTHQKNAKQTREDLTQTEEMIQKIENQVNPGKSSKKSEFKMKSDVCSYKIYMKDRVTDHLDLLREHLTRVEEQLQVKWLDLVAQISMKQKQNTKLLEKNNQLENLKQTLRQKKSIKINRQYQLSQRSSPLSRSCSGTFIQNEPNEAFSIGKQIESIDFFNKMMDNSNRFLLNNKKVGKRKIYKLSKQNTTLLNQYLRLKYENKKYIDLQNKALNHLADFQDRMNQTTLAFPESTTPNTQRVLLSKPFETPFKKYVTNRNLKSHRSLRLTPRSSALQTPRENK